MFSYNASFFNNLFYASLCSIIIIISFVISFRLVAFSSRIRLPHLVVQIYLILVTTIIPQEVLNKLGQTLLATFNLQLELPTIARVTLQAHYQVSIVIWLQVLLCNEGSYSEKAELLLSLYNRVLVTIFYFQQEQFDSNFILTVQLYPHIDPIHVLEPKVR